MKDLPLHRDSSCMEIQDNLEAYLADELDADIHATVKAHIAFCSACQNEVRFAQAIDEALHDLPMPEPPPEIFNAVSAYVRTHPNRGPRWLQRIFQLFTFSDYITSRLTRAGALVVLIGVALFGTYQYQQYVRITQASRDLNYALSQLNYAVERTGAVVNEKLPDVRIDEVSGRPFVQIENASRSVLKQKENISLAIRRSLESLSRLPENVPDTEKSQHSHQKGEN